MLLKWGVVLAAVAFRSWQGPRLGLERRDCLTFGVFAVVFGRIGMLLPGLLPPGGEAVLLGDAPLRPSLAGGIAGAAVGALLFFLLFGRNLAAYAALYLPLLPLLWWWAGGGGVAGMRCTGADSAVLCRTEHAPGRAGAASCASDGGREGRSGSAAYFLRIRRINIHAE